MSNDITIVEIQHKKEKLEKDIADLITDFEEETSLEVSTISMGRFGFEIQHRGETVGLIAPHIEAEVKL